MRITQSLVSAHPCATSANLGPGFDALGIALEMRDTYRLDVTTRETEIVVEGEGSEQVPRGEDHLVVRAIRATLEAVGAPQIGIRLHCTNVIPHGRGLGSSAAAIVGGIALARAIIDRPDALDRQEMLQIATEFDQHPDNVAPAIWGGATLAYMREGTPRAVQLRIGEGSDGAAFVAPVVLSPSFAVATREARAVLPPRVSLADAAFNAGRTGLLVHALAHDPDALFDASDDRLHQEARAEAMEASMALVTGLRADGLPAVISGAGPSVLVLRGSASRIAARVLDIVDDPDQWRIAHIPVATTGVSTVLG